MGEGMYEMMVTAVATLPADFSVSIWICANCFQTDVKLNCYQKRTFDLKAIGFGSVSNQTQMH